MREVLFNASQKEKKQGVKDMIWMFACFSVNFLIHQSERTGSITRGNFTLGDITDLLRVARPQNRKSRDVERLKVQIDTPSPHHHKTIQNKQHVIYEKIVALNWMELWNKALCGGSSTYHCCNTLSHRHKAGWSPSQRAQSAALSLQIFMVNKPKTWWSMMSEFSPIGFIFSWPHVDKCFLQIWRFIVS